MRITLAMARSVPHLQGHGYCSAGMRLFAARHGLDWQKFIREGIAEEELLATGNWLAEQVVQYANQHFAEKSEK